MIDGMRADAERYRWLRDSLKASPADTLACGIVASDAETWDGKLDAAMAAIEA